MHRLIDVSSAVISGEAFRKGAGTRLVCAEGGPRVGDLPLEILIGKARVLDVAAAEQVERDDLEGADLRDDIRLLIKNLAPLSEDAATYLAHAGLKLVGLPSHATAGAGASRSLGILRAAGVIVVLNLELGEVPPGDYDLICLPLRISGSEESPARVVLRARN
jgi:arylformamidase